MAEFDCKVEHFPPCPEIVQLHYLVKYNVQCTRWTVEQLYNVHVIFTCMNETVCLLFEQLFAWGHPCHLKQTPKTAAFDLTIGTDNRPKSLTAWRKFYLPGVQLEFPMQRHA